MKKKNTYTILGLTLLIIVIIVAALIWPVASSMLKSWRNLKTSRQNLAQLDQKKQILEELNSNADLRPVNTQAGQFLPTDEESSQLILNLSAMASQNRLRVDQTAIENATKGKAPAAEEGATPAPQGSAAAPAGAKEIQFTMKLSGSFSDFLNFLKTVEESPRLIIIRDFSSTKSVEQDKINYSVDLQGSAYYKEEAAAEPTTENLQAALENITNFLDLKTKNQAPLPAVEPGFGRPNPFDKI